ncbi:hypothetical protein SAMN02910453_1971 [Lachnospiraceae bacterium A10]|nr:hypothetical protein SAMN02910453_1971 [Lachnospiraceae bacterium A10]
MSEEQVQNNAVQAHQVAGRETVPGHDSGAEQCEPEERQTGNGTFHRIGEALQGRVEIDEAADDERQEIQQDAIVVAVFVDEFDVEEDDQHIDHSNQAEGRFVAGAQVFQRDDVFVEHRIQHHGKQDENQQDKGIVVIPKLLHCRVHAEIIDCEIKRDKE